MRATRGPAAPDPDELWTWLNKAANRLDIKADYASVLREIARRSEDRLDYERFRWFDAKAAAVADCATVRVIPHRGTDHGIAVPLSCHVRGEPDCERSRVGRILARHDVAALAAERPVFLTLTSRNAARGDLAAALRRQAASHTKLRRRAIIRGGACRHRWRDRGPTGALDGSPFHPCHEPIAAPACHGARCVEGCTDKRAGAHAAACTSGCPTRTGVHQSRCPTHPPAELHKSGCPRTCPHAGHKRGKNCATFTHRAVRGGLASFDLTWSAAAADPWNLHLHMLLDAPGWIGWAELRDMWVEVTCRTPGCRHQRLSSGAPDPSCTGAWMVWIVAVDQGDEAARHAALREVLKYVAKPHGIVDSMDPDRVEEYLWSTRHARLVTGWGCWYHVQVDEDDEADGEHHTLHFGFVRIRVPKLCPVCHVLTADIDWGYPFTAGRLEAHRTDRGYGWRHPPPIDRSSSTSPSFQEAAPWA